MQVLNKFNIDMAKKTAPTVIYAMQNDVNTRTVEIHLFSNSSPWNVPEEIAVAVAFQKPDNHKGLYNELPNGDNAITVSGNTITAILAPQVLTCSGQIRVAVVLMDENLNRIATFPFFVEAEIDPSGGSDVSNDYYKYSTMEEVSEAVESALSELETSKQDFLDKALEALEFVKDTAKEDSPAIICEETGEIISVSDSSNRTLAGLTLYGKTTQDGTPTPENPVELVSVGARGAINTTVAGKNVANINSETIRSGYYTDSSGSDTGANDRFIRALAVPALPNTEYTLSSNLEIYTVWFFDGNTSISKKRLNGTPVTFTTPENTSFLRISFHNTSGAADTVAFEWAQLEVGTIATPYESYKPIQTLTAQTPNGLPGIPVSSGGNYTDENGQQWICDEIDFGRGVYVKRVNVAKFDNATGSRNEQPKNSGLYRFNFTMAGNPGFLPTFNVNYMLCNALQPNYATLGNNDVDNAIAAYVDGGIYIRCDRFTSVEEFLAWAKIVGLEAMYPLAKPIETALEEVLIAEEIAAFKALHSNKPNTTVYNDAGAGLKLEYIADTKNYIDQKLAAISAAMLNA